VCRRDVSQRSIESIYRTDISGTQVCISPGVVRPRTLVPTATPEQGPAAVVCTTPDAHLE